MNAANLEEEVYHGPAQVGSTISNNSGGTRGPLIVPTMGNTPIIGQKRGFFVTFEGMDGSGKSHQVDLLRQALQKTNFRVSTFRSPGSTDVGETIRQVTKSTKTQLTDAAELFLMNADRSLLVEQKIKPALQDGQIVIADRFHYSTIIYQGFGREINMDMIRATTMYAINDCMPDLTFVLYISQEEADKRQARRGKTDRFESETPEYHARIKRGYDWLVDMASSSNGRVIAIDTSGNLEDTHNEIYRCMAARISVLPEGRLDLAKKIIT